MPTPATHLALGQQMLHSGQQMLHQDDLSPAARHLLDRWEGPFLLGHTAPDVKTISGQRREESHFYTIPRTSDYPAYRILFDMHPELARADLLSPPRAAFVAGYIAHLLLDELWLDDVFERYFLQDWGPLGERLFLHNVLRTWVDLRDQARLNGTAAQALQRAEPDDWLPFVDDEHVRRWRDWLVEQLTAGHRMETARVLADRMGVPAAEVEAVVQSPEQMERRVFQHFPKSAMDTFCEKGYRQSMMLVNWYVGRSANGQTKRSPINISDYEPTDHSTTQEVCS